MYIYMYVCKYVHISIYVYLYMYISVYLYMHICIMHMYTYILVYVVVCLFGNSLCFCHLYRFVMNPYANAGLHILSRSGEPCQLVFLLKHEPPPKTQVSRQASEVVVWALGRRVQDPLGNSLIYA